MEKGLSFMEADTILLIFVFKMNGYIFRGSNSAIFIFASFLNGGQLLKERICSYRSKFFPLRVDTILEGVCCSGK